jgi:hypothetical protein
VVLAAEHCCGWKGLLIYLSRSPAITLTRTYPHAHRITLLCRGASTALSAKISQLKYASSHPVILNAATKVRPPYRPIPRHFPAWSHTITNRSLRQLSIVGDAEADVGGIRSSQHGITLDADLFVDPVGCAVALRERHLRSFPASSYSSAALNTNPLKSSQPNRMLQH